jgi:iron(III) transport system ATP-binding protein
MTRHPQPVPPAPGDDAPLALIVDRVTRRYGALAAVEAASLTLVPGEITALVGPSGAGKSTLLRIIAGLEPLDAGEVRLGEQILSAPGRTVPPEKRRIGLVFQDYALFPHLTALANTAFGLNHLPKEVARARALGGLEAVGLGHRAHAYPHQLSGGEQQRVALARALAPEPVALLLDEPFSGLDPVLRAEVRQATLDAVARSGAATLIVTHDTEEALRAAHSLIVMRQGAIVQTGTPEAIYSRPASAAIASALGPVNLFSGRVSSGDAVFALGRALTPLADDSVVDVIIREEGLLLTPAHAKPGQVGTPTAQVLAVRRTGPQVLVEIMLASGEHARALVAPGAAPMVGDTVSVTIDPSLTFVFAR